MLVGWGYTAFEGVSDIIHERKKNMFIKAVSGITYFLNVSLFALHKYLCCFSRHKASDITFWTILVFCLDIHDNFVEYAVFFVFVFCL